MKYLTIFLQNPLFLIIAGFFLFGGKKGEGGDSDYFNTGGSNSNTGGSGSNTGGSNQPTISPAKAESYAARLYTEMGEEIFYSSNTKIKSILNEIATEPNYMLVHQKFGLKDYGDIIGSASWFGEPMNLTQWLHHELNNETDLQFLSNLFPNIF